jgi:hypothetical protein
MPALLGPSERAYLNHWSNVIFETVPELLLMNLCILQTGGLLPNGSSW